MAFLYLARVWTIIWTQIWVEVSPPTHFILSLIHALVSSLLSISCVTAMVAVLTTMVPTWISVWGLLLSTTAALVTSQRQAEPRAVEPERHGLQKRQTCNTATNRQCWTTSPAFDINTDYEASWPNTGVTRTVCWVIRQGCFSQHW